MGGTLIVSLDFELFWGMLDRCDLAQYRQNVLGGREAIPALLALFQKYNIHATWATVGLQFCRDGQEAQGYFPDQKPTYADSRIDPYAYLTGIRREDEGCFYAPELIAQIAATPGQEIGSHTFCHFYCREKGQTPQQFRCDLQAAQAAAKGRGYTLTSLVLPRNQTEGAYTQILPELGFTAFRGEEDDWIHRNIHFRPLLRALRLADVYLPLTGQGGYLPQKEDGVWNLTGSRMYKPIRHSLGALEGLKLRRIQKQMRHAAENNLTFHLWFHPHNIGVDTPAHLAQLEEIFRYYDGLRREYGMVSRNMAETVAALEQEGKA